MAERDNCAVICVDCEGTGGVEVEHDLFEGRVLRNDIVRVFGSSCGYVHTDKDVEGENGVVYEFGKYGCTYEEWLAGAEPKPMEQLYCPYIWKNHGIGHEPLARCKEMTGCGQISRCGYYNDKAQCWKEYWAKQKEGDVNG
jgi:hypothetical protein